MSAEEAYEKFYPAMRELVLADTAYRNACVNSDADNARTEGHAAVLRAALTIQDADFMRMFYDDPDTSTRMRDALVEDTYGELAPAREPAAQEAVEEPDDFSDIDAAAVREQLERGNNPAVDAILKAAKEAYAQSDEPSYERFKVIEAEGGFAVWDDIRDEIYVDEEGTARTFPTEEQADGYRQQVKQAVEEQESREWL